MLRCRTPCTAALVAARPCLPQPRVAPRRALSTHNPRCISSTATRAVASRAPPVFCTYNPRAPRSVAPIAPCHPPLALSVRHYRGPPRDWRPQRQHYVPRSLRWSVSQLGEEQLTWLLIIVNVLVFLLWWLLSQTAAGRKWMIDNFTVSLKNVRAGRVWTILTSNYSHAQLTHLLVNCVGLYFFCPPVIAALGTRRFLGLYTVGGVCSSFAHLFMHRRDPSSPALGASGALNGVSVMFGLMNPTATLLLWGFIPMPAGVATALFVGKDLMGLVGGSRDHISHEGHLAGAAVGGLYYLALRR